VAVLELVPVLEADLVSEPVPVCDGVLDWDREPEPDAEGGAPEEEGAGPEEEATTGGEDEATTGGEDEATATGGEDEAATTGGEDEATTGGDEEATTGGDEEATTGGDDEAFTPADVFPTTDDKLTLASNEEFADKFCDDVGGRIDARIDEFAVKFCDDVGGTKEVLRAPDVLRTGSNDEVAACDFTSVNKMAWRAKNAKIKRICFILKNYF